MKIESLRIQELYQKIKDERLDLSWVANRKFDDTVLELFELTCNPEDKSLVPEYLKISQEQFASVLDTSTSHTVFSQTHAFSYNDELNCCFTGSIKDSGTTFTSHDCSGKAITRIYFDFDKGICEEKINWFIDTTHILPVTIQYAKWKETQNILEKYKK